VTILTHIIGLGLPARPTNAIVITSIFMSRTTFAISAVAGSFTEEAAHKYLSNTQMKAEFQYVGTAHNAFEHVANGKSTYAIIPIRNSNAGFVLENLRASADFTRLQSLSTSKLAGPTRYVSFGHNRDNVPATSSYSMQRISGQPLVACLKK
jgi:hypothetical protein